MAKPKFRWWKAFKKGIVPALGTYVVTTLQNGDVSLGQIITAPQEQIPAVLGALAVGALPALVNTWKNRDKPGNPFYTPPSYLPLVLCALALGGMVAGCSTTQHTDGTIVREIDISADDIATAWAIYEAVQAHRARIEAERDAADAADRARLEMQLRALSEAAERAYDRWLDAGGRLPG